MHHEQRLQYRLLCVRWGWQKQIGQQQHGWKSETKKTVRPKPAQTYARKNIHVTHLHKHLTAFKLQREAKCVEKWRVWRDQYPVRQQIAGVSGPRRCWTEFKLFKERFMYLALRISTKAISSQHCSVRRCMHLKGNIHKHGAGTA